MTTKKYSATKVFECQEEQSKKVIEAQEQEKVCRKKDSKS